MYVSRSRSRLPLLILSTLALLTVLFEGPSPVRADSCVLLATCDGVINPVVVEY